MMLLLILFVAATVTTGANGQIEGRLLDDSEDNLESIELKSGLMMREVPFRNMIPAEGTKRFKCHACEPPNCEETATGRHICLNAVQCWKARVREGEIQLLFCDLL